MNGLVLAILFVLCGCAETRLYEHGALVATIQGDATNVTLTTPSLYFHADVLNHSVPTSAAYVGGTKMVSGLGSAVVSGLLAVP